jgi:hypothetical protein
MGEEEFQALLMLGAGSVSCASMILAVLTAIVWQSPDPLTTEDNDCCPT